MRASDGPGPSGFDRVRVVEVGRRSARHVLVLLPGTSAGAGYFVPVAEDLVAALDGWQVWAVDRRENLLEDHSVLDRAKTGSVDGRELFNYYLGWVANPAIARHYQPPPDEQVAFARRWGMRVAVQDVARALSGVTARVDGIAWFHARRLTLDAQAIAGGVANRAQALLGLRATRGIAVHVPIYAIETSFLKGRILTAARALARRAHVRSREVTLVDRSAKYAHSDPLFDDPANNDFLSRSFRSCSGSTQPAQSAGPARPTPRDVWDDNLARVVRALQADGA